MVATALAPWAGAALSGVLGGYPTLFWLLSGVALLAAALAAGSVPPAVPPEQTLAAQHGGAGGGVESGAA
ncbi:hypothetical protein GCM10009608_32710 [Pseudonocardia alaniniphila]